MPKIPELKILPLSKLSNVDLIPIENLDGNPNETFAVEIATLVQYLQGTGTTSVESVNGEVGVVVLTTGDIDESDNRLYMTQTEKTIVSRANTNWKGYYENLAALLAAIPIGERGDWAIVEENSSIYIWDATANSWEDTGDSIQVIDNLTTQDATAALSANQGYVLKGLIDEFGITKITVSQTLHPFVERSPVFFTGSAWAAADNSNPDLQAKGVVVEVIDPNTFVVAFSGTHRLSGLTANTTYYLGVGALTNVKPSDGLFVQNLGYSIDGDSFIVNIDEIFRNWNVINSDNLVEGSVQLLLTQAERDLIATIPSLGGGGTVTLVNGGAGITVDNTNSATPIVISQGLKQVSEGAGIGHRLVIEDDTFHGNIGLRALDLSYGEFPSNTGALGNYSFAIGRETTATGLYSIVGGYNSLSQGDYSIALGNGVRMLSESGIALGKFNLGSTTDTYLEFGDGTSDVSRRNILTLYKDGTLEVPLATTSLIDSRGAKALVTKEWVEENGGVPTGLAVLDEGNGVGWRLIGRSDLNYDNIGLEATDVSFSDVVSSAYGAAGTASFAANKLTYASAEYSSAFGIGTIARNSGSFSLGSFNIGTSGTSIFEIGIGSSAGNKKNAIEVHNTGEVLAPELTQAIITADATGRVLTTKEWVIANSGGSGGGDMTKAVYDTNANNKVDLAEDSELVNGLTVETAVPLGAVFTDTLYDDTVIQAHIANTDLHLSADERAAMDNTTTLNAGNPFVSLSDLIPYVSSTLAFANDNRLLRSDGVNRLAQTSGIVIDDSDNMTGVNSVNFNSIASPSYSEGLVWYDNVNKTLNLYTDEPDVTLQIGEELWFIAKNNTGATITNGQVVYISGDDAGVPTIALANASVEISSTSVIGLATHDIEVGTIGRVTTAGTVRDVDTSTANSGDVLWLDTTDGSWSTTQPRSPNWSVQLGTVTKSNALTGSIEVHITRGTNTVDILTFFNGAILEDYAIQIYSDGTNVFASLESAGGGDLSVVFDGKFVFQDTTPQAVTQLVSGTDTVPVRNYVYVSELTYQLEASTVGFPTTHQFVPVADVLIQSPASVQADNAYKTHEWADHLVDTTDQGHLQHLNKWIRNQHATYLSGMDLVLTGSGTSSVTIANGSGNILQLHEHTFPAMADGADIYVINDPTVPYRKITNLADITVDANGDTISNKTFALVIWAAVNQEAADCKWFVNLPNGSYGANKQTDARNDANKYTNYSIDNNFKGVGVLNHRLICSKSGANLTVDFNGAGDDLRGQYPNSSAGSSSGIASEFPDATFRIYNAVDLTKEIQFDASGITTATTRILTAPNADGIIPLSVNGQVADANGAITISTSGGAVNTVVGGIGIDVDATDPVNPIVSSATFEDLNEGNGVGFRVVGRSALNYGNIGLNALDLSVSIGTSTTRGATGESSLAFGLETTASGKGALASGNTSQADGWYASAFGYHTSAGGFQAFAIGSSTNAGGISTLAAGNSTIATGDYSAAFGVGTKSLNQGSFSMGNWNIGTDVNSVLEIGIGTGSGDKKNGFVTYLDGTAEMPEATNGLIDSRGAKSLVTREWVIANGGVDTNDFVTGFTFVGGLLTATVPNQANPSISLDGRYELLGHTHTLNEITDVTASAAEVNILDLSATTLTSGWGYFADGISSASWRQLLGSEINNDQGWTSNSGTVTSISSGDGITISGTAADPIISAQGLDRITETSVGFRLIGRNASFVGNIGTEAVDMTYSGLVSSTFGATGNYSFATNYRATASGENSFAGGSQSVASGNAAIALGFLATANGNNSFACGNSTLASGLASFVAGLGTVAQNGASFAAGKYNVGTSNSTIAEIGIGSGLGFEANGFEVYSTGEVVAPSMTTTLIDNFSTGRVLATREWVSVNAGTGVVETITGGDGITVSGTAADPIITGQGLERLNEGNGDGYRIIGRVAANYGNIGLGAIDFSTSTTVNTIGATGNYSSAFGYETHSEGVNSSAFGLQTKSEGSSSVAFGANTIANNAYQSVFGQWNVATDVNTVMEIGIGTGVGDKKNAFEVYDNGTAMLPEATVAEIDTKGDKAIVTREWVKDSVPYIYAFAISDEDTEITTDLVNAKFTDYMPSGMDALEVFISLKTPSSSGVFEIDIKIDGTTMFGVKPTIDATENTSDTATTTQVITTTSLNRARKVEVFVSQAGVGATGCKVHMIGTHK